MSHVTNKISSSSSSSSTSSVVILTAKEEKVVNVFKRFIVMFNRATYERRMEATKDFTCREFYQILSHEYPQEFDCDIDFMIEALGKVGVIWPSRYFLDEEGESLSPNGQKALELFKNKYPNPATWEGLVEGNLLRLILDTILEGSPSESSHLDVYDLEEALGHLNIDLWKPKPRDVNTYQKDIAAAKRCLVEKYPHITKAEDWRKLFNNMRSNNVDLSDLLKEIKKNPREPFREAHIGAAMLELVENPNREPTLLPFTIIEPRTPSKPPVPVWNSSSSSLPTTPEKIRPISLVSTPPRSPEKVDGPTSLLASSSGSSSSSSSSSRQSSRTLSFQKRKADEDAKEEAVDSLLINPKRPSRRPDRDDSKEESKTS